MVDYFKYKSYFIYKMKKLIINTILHKNINYCFIKFSTNFYLFRNLGYFYKFSLHNLKYKQHIKKITYDDKIHLIHIAIHVLFINYYKEIINLIRFKRINQILKLNTVGGIDFESLSHISKSINNYYLNKKKIIKIIKRYKKL